LAEQSEDRVEMLFPTVLHVSELPDAARINGDLLAAIGEIRRTEPSSKPASWACDLYTTIGRPQALLDHPAFQELLAICHEKMVKYAEALRFDIRRNPPRVTECWINAYARGQGQEIHLHRNTVISGIYFVQVPSGAGATLFYSPMADVMLEPRALEGNPLNSKVAAYEPVAGRMILFRSSLRHSVMPGDFDGERVTVAFNAIV